MVATESPSPIARPLADCRVVVTRPRAHAGPLVRALRRHGAEVLRLPAQAVVADTDFDWTAAVARRGAVDAWVFTSPASVRYAAPLFAAGLGTVPSYAVGAATAAALRRHGIPAVAPTRRQDSEGLLALPGLADVRDRHVVVVGAPGGRGLIASALRERGAHVEAWSVYRRERPHWRPAELAAIAAAAPPLLVLVSSADSIANLHTGLPPAVWQRLCAATWIASSERVAAALQAAGVAKFTIAASASHADLVTAAIESLKR